MKKTSVFLFIIITLLSAVNNQSNLIAQEKTITAIRTEIPPVIDGYLNDSVWAKALPVSDFLQQEPKPGSPASFKTEVRILYDSENLYVSFMCYDPHPDKIIARELKLDGRWRSDDNVAILFDTFNDNRNAYWFGTNPLGMRDDILLTNSGYNESWNGVWDVRSAIVDSGWSAEMIFPFSTFKFYDKPQQVWGVNFERNIQRKSEQVQWTAVGKDLNFFDIAFAGNLTGLKDISRGNPIYLQPYLTAGAEQSEDNNEFVHKPGLDIKYGITQTLSLDLTVNTDFSQVESDRAVINLTRFPLFFPEKRTFFLEGANVFDFRFGGRNSLFYSRRIGIKDGEEIPIIAGAKLVGRINSSMDVGFINMQTVSKDDEPTTNYGVARVKFDVLEQSYAGVFFSNKISKDGFNRVYGADFSFETNNFLGDKALTIGAGIAKTDENGGMENSWAAKIFIDYPNDLIDQFINYRFIQENFNPAIGFISRTGIQTYSYNFRFTPRINWGDIKKLNFSPIESDFDLDKNNDLLAADITIQPFGFSTVQGDQFSVEINRSFDRVDEAFEIFEGNTIDKGRYWFTSYEAGFNTATSRDISGGGGFKAGNFYTGTSNSIFVALNWAMNEHLSMSADFDHNNIKLEGGKFKTNEFTTRIRYDFSTKVNSSVFAQWNNELDLININYRFNWEPNVGSNFYLVLNQALSTTDKIKTTDFTILAKLVWQFII